MLQSKIWPLDVLLNGEAPSVKALENSGVLETSCAVLRIFKLPDLELRSEWCCIGRHNCLHPSITHSLALSFSLYWMLRVWSVLQLVFVQPLAHWLNDSGVILLCQLCRLTCRPLNSLLCSCAAAAGVLITRLFYSLSFTQLLFLSLEGKFRIYHGLQWCEIQLISFIVLKVVTPASSLLHNVVKFVLKINQKHSAINQNRSSKLVNARKMQHTRTSSTHYGNVHQPNWIWRPMFFICLSECLDLNAN